MEDQSPAEEVTYQEPAKGKGKGRNKKNRPAAPAAAKETATEGTLETKGKDGRYRRILRSGAVAVI